MKIHENIEKQKNSANNQATDRMNRYNYVRADAVGTDVITR